MRVQIVPRCKVNSVVSASSFAYTQHNVSIIEKYCLPSTCDVIGDGAYERVR